MFFNSKNLTDSDLIAACAKGKSSAQRTVYERYFNYSMSVAMRYVSDRDEAIEVVNDGFLKVFESASSFDLSKPFKGWLRQIMIYTAIDHFRRAKKHKHDSLDQLYVEQSMDQSVLGQLDEADIMACVQGLPASYRVVFVLYVVEGYKHHEIATMLKISEGTSKSNLAVARGKLKHLLSRSENYRNHA